MAKTVVLLDSGLLKYSTRFVARNRLKIGHNEPLEVLANHPQALPAIYDVLATSLRSKLTVIQELFGRLDRVIVCLDIGDSWRTTVKKTLIPGTNVESSIAYKGHRRTDDPAELAATVKLNDIYKQALQMLTDNSGLERVGKLGIESDDFMICLSKQYADQGDNVIIVANDADITQAVYASPSGGHVFIMQPKQDGRLNWVICHATKATTANQSIFSMSTWPIGVANMISNAQIVAPQYMLLHKILNGDASDDISPVMVRDTGKRNYKLNEACFVKIFDYFSKKNTEGYFKIENCYVGNDIIAILSIAHEHLFKTSFDSLPLEWRQFYIDKFIENRHMVVVNPNELCEQYGILMKAAVEQIYGQQPVIAFPSWQTLQKLDVL